MNSNSPEVRALVQAMADKLLQVSVGHADFISLSFFRLSYHSSKIHEEN
jgi:hypothetical protein